jgi:hypothetical protein
MPNLGQLMLPPKPKHGIPTKASGYIETPIIKKCGTCKHLTGNRMNCDDKTINQDPQLKTDPKTKLKIVNPVKGFCPMWEV